MGDLFHIGDRVRVIGDPDMAGEEGPVGDVLHDRFGTLYQFGQSAVWFSDKELEAA